MLGCADPPIPSNGQFNNNGSIVTYMCEEGFVLVGNRQRFCNLTTWMWNGSDPTCEGMYGNYHIQQSLLWLRLVVTINEITQ